MCEFNAVCFDRLVGRTGHCLNRAIVRACHRILHNDTLK